MEIEPTDFCPSKWSAPGLSQLSGSIKGRITKGISKTTCNPPADIDITSYGETGSNGFKILGVHASLREGDLAAICRTDGVLYPYDASANDGREITIGYWWPR